MSGHEYLFPSYDAYDSKSLTIFSAGGDYLHTSAGTLLDLNGGAYWTSILGSGDAQVREKMLAGYSADLFGVVHPPAMELARELCARTGYARVSYSTSGSDAVDSAIRMAYQYHRAAGNALDKRSSFLTLRNGFHGTTLATLTTAGFPRRRELLPSAGAVHCLGRWVVDEKISSLDEAWVALGKEDVERENQWPAIAGFLFEPVQGVAGVRFINPFCYAVIAQRCREHDVLLMADEISTGIGRTGRFVVTEAFDPRPDILVVGKAITNGEFPLAATLVTERVWQALDAATEDPYEKYLYGSSYAGHPAGCLAALEVLRRMDESQLEAIRAKGEVIRALLVDICRTHHEIRAVRGIGLMWGLEFANADDAHRVSAELVARGIRCGNEGRVLTAFPSARTDIAFAFGALASALREIFAGWGESPQPS